MTAMTIARPIPGIAPRTATPRPDRRWKARTPTAGWIRRRSSISNRPMAEAITTAARAALGRWRRRFGAIRISKATASAPTLRQLRSRASLRDGCARRTAADRKPLEQRQRRDSPGRPFRWGRPSRRAVRRSTGHALVSADDTTATAKTADDDRTTMGRRSPGEWPDTGDAGLPFEIKGARWRSPRPRRSGPAPARGAAG